jgi:DNA replication protein DnaC
MENPTPPAQASDTPAIRATSPEASELNRILEANRRELGIGENSRDPLTVAEVIATMDHVLAESCRKFASPKRTDQQPLTAEQLAEIERRRELYTRKNLTETKERVLNRFLECVGKRYESASFESYKITKPAQQKTVAKLQEYVREFSANMIDGKGVVLFGPSGTGKDHLLVASAREIIQEHLEVHISTTRGTYGMDVCSEPKLSIRWINGLDLYGELRAGMDDKKFNECDYVAELIRPTILILSDPIPPRGALTEYQAGMLFRIIDGRYRECRPTWATLNIKNTKEADERLTPQIVDRLRDGALAIYCDWESHRKAQS